MAIDASARPDVTGGAARPSTLETLENYLGEAGATDLGHGGSRSLLDHLRGTRELLERWGQPEDLQLAGLLHSVYGTESYQHTLFTASRREDLQAMVGEGVERLAHLFGVVPRRRLFAELAGAPERTRLTRLTIPAGDGSTHWELTREEAEELVLLHAANLAEQARAGDGPGRWLCRVGQMGALLGDSHLTRPPVLHELAGMTPEREDALGELYRETVLTMADAPRSTRGFAQLIAACPLLPEPYVWTAWICLAAGDWQAAGWWAQAAGERLSELATPWDKRLEYGEWFQLAEAIAGAAEQRRLPAGAAPADPRLLLSRVWAGRRAASAAELRSGEAGRPTAGRARFHRYMDAFATPSRDPRRRLYPNLGGVPFHDPGAFPVARALTRDAAAISTEILALDPAAFAPEAEKIDRAGDWDVLFLSDRGRPNPPVCDACPTLMQVLRDRSVMNTLTGLIYVSRMRPGTHIAPHRGPTNLRVRCHLGITVPEGDCAIRVAGESRGWREGQCLVLDDHYEHEAWNHTESDRIVLIVDLWHPDLSAEEIDLLSGLHAYAYAYAVRQHRWWTRHYPADATA